MPGGLFFVLTLLLVAATGAVQTPWQGDVTEWKLGDLQDGDCKTDLQDYKNAIINLDVSNNPWALQMLDSSAKVPNGLLVFNTYHIGMFQECLDVRHPDDRFQGKHCMLTINLAPVGSSQKSLPRTPTFLQILNHKPVQEMKPQNRQAAPAALALKYGICIPSSCSANDLNTIMGNSSKITADDANCWTSEEKPLSDLAVAFISLCAVLAALTVTSTLYHYIHIYQNRKPNRLLCSFSLYLNFPKLIEIRSNDGDNMGCLHGIRSLSMMWVMLCHTYSTLTSPTSINLIEISGLMFDVKHIFISNGFYSVDSFFFLSGLLVAFVFFRNIGRSGTYDAPSGYIHRWLRLTPPFAMMVFATVSLLPDMGYGPVWSDTMTIQVQGCEDNWWSALLYLQNYLKPEGQCLGQSWYLSADMQMFWIAPFLLYPIYFWPTYGTIFLVLVTIASTLWTFGLAYTNEYKATLLQMVDLDQFKYDYVTAHSRMTPWLVGLVCGVVICAIKARKIPVRLSKPVALLGWCTSTAICLGILFSANRFYKDLDAPAVEAALYLSFTRLGWGVGLSWIVFACIHSSGGIINTFLSMGIWQPLGKLSYSVYLTHMTVLSYKLGTLQTNNYFTDLNAVYELFATLILSYLLSLLLYLTVEAPFIILDQELLGSVPILPFPKPKPKSKRLEEGAAS